MAAITVVALGPGAREHLTLGAVEALTQARRVVLRTGRHGAASYLDQQGIAYTTLDSLYEQSQDFDALIASAVQALMAEAATGPLCYGVADPAADASVQALLALPGLEVRVLPGLPLSAPMLAAHPAGPSIAVCDAMNLASGAQAQALCLTEINSRALAGQCKLQLLEQHDADTPLVFFPPSQAAWRKPLLTTLEALDRQPRYDHSAGAILLPKAGFHKERYSLRDLVAIMRRLRGPEGCPWDKEQSHLSLARYLTEEAAEAVHAIHQQDWLAATDELGDVLLQVVFHATIGEEQGSVSLNDIISAICHKLVSRHRHIFGGDRLDSADEVVKAWDSIKAEERGERSPAQKMRDLPHSLPPMLRALKVQQIARKEGFDWQDPRDALAKVHEEARELLADYEAGRDLRPEMGDLFTACINTARLMGTYPDEVVDIATEKFITRFEYMENAIRNDQKQAKSLTLDDWDVYWVRSKQAE